MFNFKLKVKTIETGVIFDYVVEARDEAEAIHAVEIRRWGMSAARLLKIRR